MNLNLVNFSQFKNTKWFDYGTGLDPIMIFVVENQKNQVVKKGTHNVRFTSEMVKKTISVYTPDE